MKSSVVIDILRFPAKKENNLKSWYHILWCLFWLPFVFVFQIGFYISYLCLTLDTYPPEAFRKDYMITLW
jgi:hypothetical protein